MRCRDRSQVPVARRSGWDHGRLARSEIQPQLAIILIVVRAGCPFDIDLGVACDPGRVMHMPRLFDRIVFV
jgi:hypothetical protein